LACLLRRRPQKRRLQRGGYFQCAETTKVDHGEADRRDSDQDMSSGSVAVWRLPMWEQAPCRPAQINLQVLRLREHCTMHCCFRTLPDMGSRVQGHLVIISTSECLPSAPIAKTRSSARPPHPPLGWLLLEVVVSPQLHNFRERAAACRPG
jgi:hypothetical protein